MRTQSLQLTCTVTIAAAALVAGWAPAVAADLSKLPPPATQAGLTYAKDIRPLFEASCFNCHGERRQRAGLRLDSLEGVLQGSDEIKVITPGNSKESTLVHAIAQIDDETAMPPRRQRGGFGGGPGGPGGPGVAGGQGGTGRGPGGAGGPGGRGGLSREGGGGFGFGDFLAAPLFSQADRDGDKKVSPSEFSQLADTWFDGLDTEKSGKLTEEQFTSRLDSVLTSTPNPARNGRPGGGGRGPGGQRGGNEGMGFGPGRMIGSSIFTAADADKDNSLTREELKATFTKWQGEWDTEKTGALTEDKFRAGLTASVMRGGGRMRGGPGGPGGAFGGMGPFGRQALAQQMITQGDADKDGKLSKAEFAALADTWFVKLDAKKSGEVNQEIFAENLAEALGLPKSEGEQGPTDRPGRGTTNGGRDARPDGNRAADAGGAPPGFGSPANLAPGLFAAIDTDKNGAVTSAELKATFTRWSGDFDAEKKGSLDADQLYAGLREKLPQGTMGGVGGFGGFGGRGDQGPARKPLTAEQVGLVRAWIDQGAK